MTSENTLPPAIPGYAMAYVAENDRRLFEKTYDEALDSMAEDTWDRVEFMEKTMGIKRPDPCERLRMYRSKPYTYQEALYITWNRLMAEGKLPQVADPLTGQAMAPQFDPMLVQQMALAGQAAITFSWEEQSQVFPRDYEQDYVVDYQALRKREEDGDLDCSEKA